MFPLPPNVLLKMKYFFDFEGRERTVHLHPNSNYDNLKPELPAGLG